MPRETKAQLEARITDQSSIIDRYARMIESLEHERDSQNDALDNMDIKFGRRNDELNSLKATIREQTLNHFDAKQQVISLSKECDLVGGALKLEIGERKKLCHELSEEKHDHNFTRMRERDFEAEALGLRGKMNAYLQAGRFACGDNTSADPVDVVRNLWKHVL